MLDKFQQAMDKINRMHKMLDKFQQVVDRINRTAGCRQNKQDAEDVRQTGSRRC